MTTVPPFPSTIPTKAAIINEIARPVTFYTIYSSQACPDCALDPVTNESTDSFCETCEGVYWIPTYSGYTYSGHVTWKFSDRQQWETAGILFNGDCLVKIMYSDSANTIIKNTKYVIVDEHTMDVDRVTYRGATEIDRILVELKERDRN